MTTDWMASILYLVACSGATLVLEIEGSAFFSAQTVTILAAVKTTPYSRLFFWAPIICFDSTESRSRHTPRKRWRGELSTQAYGYLNMAIE